MKASELQAVLQAIVDLAAIARKYFVELLKQGFTEDQALQLTIAFVNTTVQPKPDQAPLSRFGNLNFM